MNKSYKLSRLATALSVLGGVYLLSNPAMAQAPAHGTSISNIATATYVDNTGATRTVTSNAVTTEVAQVGGFTLEQNNSKTSAPNSQVTFAHTLTNTGNGTDSFTFALANVTTDNFDFASGRYAIYLDADSNGIPDDLGKNLADVGASPIILDAGKKAQILVVATTPSSVTAGQKGILEITATSTKASTIYANAAAGTDSNTDTVNITGDAVVTIRKAADKVKAKVGEVITYTLTFTNTGNATAKNLTVFDSLPADLVYVPNSAVYSNGGTQTDAIDTQDKFYWDATKKRFMLNIDQLAPNVTETLIFKATLAKTTEESVQNTAYVDPDGKPNPNYDPTKPVGPGNEPTLPLTPGSTTPEDQPTPTDTTTTPSNPSIVEVEATYKGAVNDTKSDDFADNETPAGGGDDKITKSGQQGVPVVFGNSTTDGDMVVVHNSGDRVDTYNFDITGLPSGAIVTILKSDGATPVTDTNGDGTPDTGPIQPQQSEKFVVRVTFPSTYSTETPVNLELVSTSITNGVKDTLDLIIDKVTGKKVDVVSRPDPSDPTKDKGQGAGTNTPVETDQTPPGTPTEFDVTVKNPGSTPDNYDIHVPSVPPGWTVEIVEKKPDGSCSSTTATNTGTLQAGESKSYCLVVTPPTTAQPGDKGTITVNVESPSSGAKDHIVYEVTTEEVRALTFNPDNEGQIAPGGTITHKHTLKNTGNITEALNSGYDLNLTYTSTLPGATTSVYVDVNKDGVLDLSELITDSKTLNDLLVDGLSPNETVDIYVKIEAPTSAQPGATDTTIVTLTPENPTTGKQLPPIKVTDLTTINLGQVRLEKTQALAAGCTAVPAAADFKITDLTAKPGDCVYYKISAKNEGNVAATNVVINDKVPSYTQLVTGSLKTTHSANAQPNAASVNNGSISYDVGSLGGSQNATLEFGVELDK